MKKRIDLGEYIITIEYDEDSNRLIVNVLDQLEYLIESIQINDDMDESFDEFESDNNNPTDNINLN
jgi:hypothetical protein